MNKTVWFFPKLAGARWSLVSGKKADRRVQRTQRLLHQALMSSIVEKRYESITVQEILDRADVGRSTFYMHYRDKDELLADGLQHLKGLLISAQSCSAAPPGRPYEKIIGFSLAIFEHLAARRELLRALLGSSAEPVVRRAIHSALTAVVGQEVEKEFQRRKRKAGPVSRELVTHFLVSTYISMLTWWLNSKNPSPPKDIDAAYGQLVLPCLASIFGEQHIQK